MRIKRSIMQDYQRLDYILVVFYCIAEKGENSTLMHSFFIACAAQYWIHYPKNLSYQGKCFHGNTSRCCVKFTECLSAELYSRDTPRKLWSSNWSLQSKATTGGSCHPPLTYFFLDNCSAENYFILKGSAQTWGLRFISYGALLSEVMLCVLWALHLHCCKPCTGACYKTFNFFLENGMQPSQVNGMQSKCVHELNLH